MKKITLLLFLMAFSFGNSQTIPVTFETVTVGPNWKVDSGLASVGVVNDPVVAGTHGKVGQITSSATGEKWQNAQLLMTTNHLDLRTNQNITLDVYTTAPQSFLLKVEQPKTGSGTHEKSFTTAGTGWETIVVNVTGATDQYKLAVIFPCYSPAFANAPFSGVTYIDNVSAMVGDAIVVAAGTPTVAAPTPPARIATDVKSIYSDSYAVYNAGNWCKCWGQNTDVTDELIAANNTRKLTNFNYQGITGGPFVLGDMTKVHVDLWFGDSTGFKFFPLQSGNPETSVTLTPYQAGWNSFDIDLNTATFSGVTNFNTVAEFKIESVNAGVNVYLDNLYFYRPASNPAADATLSDLKVDGTTVAGFSGSSLTYTVSKPTGTTVVPQITLATPTQSSPASAVITQATTIPGSATVLVTAQDGTTTKTYTVNYTLSGPGVAAPIPPARNAADVISLYSGAYSNVASNFDAGWCGNGSVQEVVIAGNPTMAYKGNNCQGIVLNAGVDASTFTRFHCDVYIEAGTDLTSSVFNFKFVQQPGGGFLEKNFNVGTTPALVAGSWMTIDVAVDLTSFTGFKEFAISSNLFNKVWYDNLYVYKGVALSVTDFKALNINMYPNPVAEVLNITAAEAIQKVTVFNLLGQEVLSQQVNANSVSINTSAIQSGVYIVTAEIGGKTASSKFVKK